MGEGERQLKAAGIAQARLEAEQLVCHAARLDRLGLYLALDRPAGSGVREKARKLFRQRASRAPLQYLTGTQEFWGLEFDVTPDVLIPRPETEGLVEETVRLIGLERPKSACTLIEIGTGSGCIAVSLAKAVPNARILATDRSAKAIAVARRNARRRRSWKTRRA